MTGIFRRRPRAALQQIRPSTAPVKTPQLFSITPVTTGAVQSTNTLSYGPFTPEDNELILVFSSSPAGDGLTFNAPAATGLTFQSRGFDNTASHNRAGLWSAQVATSPGSTTINWTWNGTANYHSMMVLRWRYAQLAASPAIRIITGTASLPNTTLTTTGELSAIAALFTDWVPTNPATRAWDATSGVFQEDYLENVASNYWTSYGHMMVGAAGSKTLAMTAPTGQNWTVLAIEVQAKVAAPAAQNITATGIASSFASGSHTVSAGPVVVQPTGLASVAAFGSTSVARKLAPTGIVSAEAFGSSYIKFVRTADMAGGVNDWDSGPQDSAATARDHTSIAIPSFGAYYDSYALHATIDADVTATNAFARGLLDVKRYNLHEGADFWYGVALYLVPGTLVNIADSGGVLDVMRWDDFDTTSGVNVHHGGVTFFGTDENLRLIRDGGGGGLATLLSGIVVTEGAWHWIEVHQILGTVDGQAYNEIFLDGVSQGSNTTRNLNSSITRIDWCRYGVVGIGAGAQTAALDLWVDRARIGTNKIGPSLIVSGIPSAEAFGTTTLTPSARPVRPVGISAPIINPATPGFVKETVGSAVTATGTTASVTSTAGNSLLALVTRSGGFATGFLTGITDSAGNVWEPIDRGAVVGVSNTRIELWAAFNAAAVTSVTFASGTSQTWAWNIFEFSNLGASLDVMSPDYSSHASSTTITTPSVTPTQNKVLAVAAAHFSQTTATLTTGGWTALSNFDDAAVGSGRAAWIVQATPAALSAAWSLGTARQAGILTVALVPKGDPAVGSASVAITRNVSPTGISSATVFGTATVSRGAATVSPSGISSGLAFGTAAISPGGVIVVPTGIVSSLTFGTATISRGVATVVPSGIASSLTFGSSTISRNVVPAGITSGLTFGAATVGRGAITVVPTGIVSSLTFGTTTISRGAIAVVPTGITSALVFGTATVAGVSTGKAPPLVHPVRRILHLLVR